MLLTFIIVFSVIAAFLNAWSAVIQHYEAGEVKPEELFRRDFIKRLSTSRKWLGAFGLQILAFVFQAAALRNGSLILVQPIMTIDLVFLLLILHFHKKMTIGKKEWLAIAMICIGLTCALLLASPTAGTGPYHSSSLFVAVCVTAVVILVGIYVVRRTMSRKYRALIAAIAAGFSYALVDVFAKIVSREVGHGFVDLITGWQVWALAAVGTVSVIMMQNAYGAGPVTITQPSMEIVEPVVAVALGIYIFGDSVNLSALNLCLALVSGAVVCLGIISLSRSKRLQIQKV